MQLDKSKWAAALTILLAFSGSTAALASGGTGGGGGTSGGGGSGGGGSVKNCSPSITLAASASTLSGERSLTASFTTACASKSHVTLTAVNTSTGRLEWVAPVDSVLTSYTWNAPLFGTTYRIDATLTSNAGPLLASASTTLTTLPAPPDCGPFLTVDAAAGTTATTFAITATYSLVWCGGPSNVMVTATNTDTGVTEWAQYATVTSNLLFSTPKFSTNYRIDATAYDGSTVLARASQSLTTIAAPPNCATIAGENISAGYWGTYAAIWISTSARDCGYGRTSVHMRITNLTSGLVEYEVSGLPLDTLIDFEGPVVKYDATYQIDVDVRGAMDEVLDSRSQTIVAPPLR
jgi:hypothetical protein